MIGEERLEAKDLIKRMISRESKKRPEADEILSHPYFWDAQKRLTFLTDLSDRMEGEVRDPPSPMLRNLERGAVKIVGDDWYKKIDRLLKENLKERRSYDGTSVRDLLRAMRNKRHHYQDLGDKLQGALGELPSGFLSYFITRFPNLFLHAYHHVGNTSKLREDSIMKRYFE
jgi:serine/threonine protein kinase